MECVPLGRELVLRPCLLNMNQCALALAKEQMLKCGDGEEIHGHDAIGRGAG